MPKSTTQLSARAANDRTSLTLLHVVILLTVLASAVRFIGLGSSPRGFYVDEAAISAQVICVSQSGRDLWGEKFPLMSRVLRGGYVTPTYLYPSAAWIKVFGNSIAGFRSMTAFFSLLFIGGAFFLGRAIWRTREAAWLCALTAALSPWAFQFARIAWDPALSPAFLVWAFAMLFEARRKPFWYSILGGAVLAGAAYSYPPIRVQGALAAVFAGLLILREDKAAWKKLVVFAVSAFVFALPLVELTLSGEIQRRFEVLSIFNAEFLAQHGGDSAWNIVRIFSSNLGLNFSGNYLFLSGDLNPRHSTGAVGEWSWVDILGVIAFITALIQVWKKKTASFSIDPFSFCAFGYLMGIVPAALTWESNPHALRSIGAVVFLSIFAGGALALVWKRHVGWRLATVILGAAFFGYFTQVYFGEYTDKSAPYFDADVTELAREYTLDGKMAQFQTGLNPEYPEIGRVYFELVAGTKSCR